MVECDECGKDITSYYEVDKHKLCLGCYADIDTDSKGKSDKKVVTDIPRKIEFRTRPTHLGTVLRICGVLSTIICLIAGFSMISIRSAGDTTIMQAYYNSMGIFVIGLSLAIGSLLWGIAYLIDNK